tara:strand:- start:2896 stop:3648 length:753 start_codon:yes stop_codon:yes gene_type:complete
MNKKDIINNIFYPRKSDYKSSALYDYINVDDAVKIGLCFYLKDSSYDNIIFFHGNAELAEEYRDISNIYENFKINLIVADFRGYGMSDGVPTKDNLLSDAPKIFNYISKDLNSKNYNQKKVVMGRSLGSASALEIASKDYDNIDGCIIESGFATEIPLFKLFGLNSDDLNFKVSDGFNNLSKAKNFEKPLFVIHAKNDHIVPFSEGELIYSSSLSKNKDILVVEQANHNNIINCIGLEYFQAIRSFIDTI